jgi:hypothetical protein
MSRALFNFVAVVALSPAVALAQQAQEPQPSAPDARAACRQEIRRLCIQGALPIPPLIQRCVAENQSKLSPQCRKLIQAGHEARGAN